MEIVESLPLDCCRDCKECVLKVKEQTIFNGNTDRMEIVLNVSCGNENRCKKVGAYGHSVANGTGH